MKFTILAICVAVAAAKPHIYLYNGPPAVPIGSDGRVIDTPEVALAKAAHLAALASASVKAKSDKTVETGYLYPIPVTTYGIYEHVFGNEGPSAPLAEDSRVFDTAEVAQSTAERLSAFEKANVEAATAKASAAAHGKLHAVYGIPMTVSQLQEVPTFIMAEPIAEQVQGYEGPPAPIRQDEHIVDTEKVSKLKAKNLTTLAETQDKAAGFAATSGTSSSSKDYADEAITVQHTETVVVPKPLYSGPPAPLGEDGRVIDTEEVAKLKAEHLAALERANAAAIASAAASGASMSTLSPEGHTYFAPVVQYTGPLAVEIPFVQSQHVYNGPSVSVDEDERVTDTEEVAKPKAEHLAALDQANTAAAAFAAASGSSMSTFSSEGYTNAAPIQHTETLAIETPVVKPQRVYNGPPAPLGEDGRVIDTEEIAKLKAEHLAVLEKANAAAIALAAASGSSMSTCSSEGCTYVAPAVKRTESLAIDTPVIEPQNVYNRPQAPVSEDGSVIDTEEIAKLKAEHLAALNHANAAAIALATVSGSSVSTFTSDGYTCVIPVVQHTESLPIATTTVKPHQFYNEPPSLIGEDVGRLATLAEPTAEAAVKAAAEVAEEPEAVVHSPPLPAVRAPSNFTAPVTEIKPVATPVRAHALVQRVIRRRPYTGPPAPLGANGQVVDTEEVAKLKAERLSTLKHATDYAIKLANTRKTATSRAQIVE